MRRNWNPRNPVDEVEALVAQAVSRVTTRVIRRATTRDVLRCAADMIISASRGFGPEVKASQEEALDVVTRARGELGVSDDAWAKVPLVSRLELQRAVFFALRIGEEMERDYFQSYAPHEPDYLITPGNVDEALEEMEREESIGPAASREWTDEEIVAEWTRSEDSVPPVARPIGVEPAACRPGVVYEVRIGVGDTWQEAVKTTDGKKWNRPRGGWLAYRSSVSAARVREDDVRILIETLLRDRREGLSAGLSEKAIDGRAELTAGKLADGYVLGRDGDCWLCLQEDLLSAYRYKANALHCIVLVRKSDGMVVTGAELPRSIMGSWDDAARAVRETAAAVGFEARRVTSPVAHRLPADEIWSAFSRPAGVWDDAAYGDINVTSAGKGLFHIPGWSPTNEPDGPDGDRADAPEAADAVDDLPPQEEIDRSVGSVLRQYRYNVGTLGPAAADSWAEADIAREASRIAPPLADSRYPDWQRVHDAIRRRFNRFVVHVDDTETLPDGNYQVWIKGWDAWVPARIERGGQTWKLPIGRVSAVGIDDVVAAVRPLAA